ncbi:MAG: hypothetical protein ACYCOY_00475 [Metallibacterium sp.]
MKSKPVDSLDIIPEPLLHRIYSQQPMPSEVQRAATFYEAARVVRALPPVTGQRVLALYKWNSIDQFCARDSIRPRPTYASQRVSGSDSIMEQRWAIRRKLGDTFSDLFSEPTSKPGAIRVFAFRLGLRPAAARRGARILRPVYAAHDRARRETPASG